MISKLICYPFRNGNLLEFAFTSLTDDEKIQVYDIGEITKYSIWDNDYSETWKPYEEFEATLHYRSYARGRSSITFYWIDDDSHQYPMFLKDFDKLLKQDINVLHIHGVWGYVKRGSDYGIKFIRKIT